MSRTARNYRHFADGGAVKETPDELMARMAKKYGAPGAGTPGPAPEQVHPADAPVVQPKPTENHGIGGIIQLMKGRKAQLDKAIDGYACGGKIKGMASGGKINGPGTPTSDSIAAVVKPTNEPIKVSTNERILSAMQDAMLEAMAKKMGFDNLDAMLEAGTGQPVGPTIKAGTKAAANGMAIDGVIRDGNSFSQDLSKSAQTGQEAAYNKDLMKPNPTQAQPSDLSNPLATISQPTAAVSAEPSIMPPVTATAVSQPQPAAQVGNAPYQAGGSSDPHASFSPSAPKPSGIGQSISDNWQSAKSTMTPISELFQKRQFANGGALSEDEITKRVMNDRFNAMYANNSDISNKPAPAAQPVAARLTVADMEAKKAPWLAPIVNGIGGGIDAVEKAFTPKSGPVNFPAYVGHEERAAQRQLASAPQPGAQERTYGAMTANPLSTINSSATNVASAPLGNSVTPENSITRSGSAFSGKGTGNPLADGVPFDPNASLARANAIRQSMLDNNAGARVDRGIDSGIIKNTGLSDTQALMDKWGRQDAAQSMLQEIARNPKAAGAIAGLYGANMNADAASNAQENNIQLAGIADFSRRQGQSMDAETRRRGQDIEASSQAEKLAGNPLTNNLIKAQTGLAESELSDKKSQSAMMTEIQDAATSPERRKQLTDALLAAQGKSPNDNRYLVQNVKTYNEMGQVTGEEPRIFDKQSGQMVNAGKSSAPDIPQGAAAMLKANPSLAADFDKKYGAGAAQQILGK